MREEDTYKDYSYIIDILASGNIEMLEELSAIDLDIDIHTYKVGKPLYQTQDAALMSGNQRPGR